MNLSYAKPVYDAASNRHDFAWTWQKINFGTHGGQEYILSVVSEFMDEFLAEFLRVNEEACEKRFALPNPRSKESFKKR